MRQVTSIFPGGHSRAGMRLHHDTFLHTTRLRTWFPALPFIIYWCSSFLLYHFGPLVYPPLHSATYVYLLAGFAAFLVGYRVGIAKVARRPCSNVADVVHRERYVLRHIRLFLPLGLLGCLGFVVDRLMSGAGGVAKTFTETEFVRDSYADTGLLTTLSVVPYSFSFAGLALYFYACAARWKLSVVLHGCAMGILLVPCFNSFLCANRGSFFWTLTYVAFYFLFVKGESLRAISLQRRYFGYRAAVAGFVAIAVGYSVFVAVMRNNERYLRGCVQAWTRNTRYGIESTNLETRQLGSLLQLVIYGTHEYEFVDAFVDRAKPFAFHPEFLLGRLLDPLRLAMPTYVPATVRIKQEWVAEAELPQSAWPSVFGWLLVMFGYLGAPLFMLFLGLLFGSLVGRFLTHFDAAALIAIFCLYAALNMSFNWIGGDFSHNAGYLIAAVLFLTRRPSYRRCRGSLRQPSSALQQFRQAKSLIASAQTTGGPLRTSAPASSERRFVPEPYATGTNGFCDAKEGHGTSKCTG